MSNWYKDGQEFTENEVADLHPNTIRPFNPADLGYTAILETPKPAITDLQVAYIDGSEIDTLGNRVRVWSVQDKFSDYTDKDGILHTKAEQESAYLEAQRKAMVPPSITKWQAKLVLLDINMLATVQAIIDANPAKQIVWDGVTTFERSNGLITQIGVSSMALSDEQIDKMFIAANRYTAEMVSDPIARQAILAEVGLV